MKNIFLCCTFFHGLAIFANVENAAEHFSSQYDRLLLFEDEHVNLGAFFIGEEKTVSLPFRNPLNTSIVLEHTSDHRYDKCFEPYGVWGNRTIGPGERDTLVLKIKPNLRDHEEGMHKEHWSFWIANHLWCKSVILGYEILLDMGKLEASKVVLDTIDVHDSVLFQIPVTNTGTHPITIYPWERYWPRFITSLNPDTITFEPGEVRNMAYMFYAESWLDQSYRMTYNSNRPTQRRSFNFHVSTYIRADSFPIIEFDSLVKYLYCDERGNGNFDYRFTNTGKMPLIISTVKTSCGCLVASRPKEPILPGESGIIRAKYDTKRIGPVNKSITVTSNASQPRIVLRVKGMVNRLE